MEILPEQFFVKTRTEIQYFTHAYEKSKWQYVHNVHMYTILMQCSHVQNVHMIFLACTQCSHNPSMLKKERFVLFEVECFLG